MPNHRLLQSAAAGSGGGLYDFTTYSFEVQLATNTGMDLATTQSTFSGQPFSNDTDLMNVSTAGYIDWTVPITGTYEITADGASGQRGGSYPGGLGARATATFSLEQGNILRMIIGHKPNSNGGGGMTAVIWGADIPTLEKTVDYFDVNALLVAGGGGGSGSNSNDGDPGQAGTSGSTNGSNQSAGTGGNGGNATATYGGGGGSGFRTSGQPGRSGGSQGFTGTYTNGFIGGTAGGGFLSTGGFGGGGSGSWTGGGGGGYSGGAGFGPADGYTFERQGGGGGGSYITASHSTFISSSGVTAGGNTDEWGKVVVTLL